MDRFLNILCIIASTIGLIVALIIAMVGVGIFCTVDENGFGAILSGIIFLCFAVLMAILGILGIVVSKE